MLQVRMTDSSAPQETAPRHTVPLLEEDRSPWLTIAFSPQAEREGEAFALAKALRVGRSADGENDLAVNDQAMSRCHATLSLFRGKATLSDHQSRNGSSVNGVKVRDTCALEHDAVIRLGDTLFVLGYGAFSEVSAEDEGELLGRSPHMAHIRSEIDRVAHSAIPVLAIGETGTGKELVAKRLHEKSGRVGPLVSVNCAALPSDLVESMLFGHKKGAFTGAEQDALGYFLSARGGTLFLDEIGELPLFLQGKLLRVLETGELSPVGSTQILRSDARVVAATNRNLNAEVAAGSFRADLYARLCGYHLEVPPLRRRRCDIVRLARHFLALAAPERPFEWTCGLAEQLLLHDWPMNVRELKNVMQQLSFSKDSRLGTAAVSRLLEARQVTTEAADAAVPSEEQLKAQLARFAGNVSELAKFYDKHPKQIYRWLKKYGLSADRFR